MAFILRNDSARALVTTGLGKFYSNGLDLQEMMKSNDGGREFLRSAQKVFHRLLVFPKPTVAALNGRISALPYSYTLVLCLYRSCVCCRWHDSIVTRLPYYEK